VPTLLDSIYAQDCKDFEVVICEDDSPQRERIAAIAGDYSGRYPGTLHYFENEVNLGYDGNIRRLVERASGEYCFFMGNDDLLCPGALGEVAGTLDRHSNVGIVIKSYAWFDEVPEKINQEVRYFTEEREFTAGVEAIRICFRRSGVISGYVVHRDSAQAAATSKFDGTLSYQMHLTANVLVERCAVFTPKVLVLCRLTPPDFGSSASEKGKFVPGHYTPEARLRMVSGALSIVENLRNTRDIDVVDDVIRDYANYFYPYIKDQLGLPFEDYMRLYQGYKRIGFGRYPMFHLYCVMGYALGENNFDKLTRIVRGILGRSPQFGAAGSTQPR
jgi:glycosyltransferase involved in cell wall biosynthesis